MTDEKLKEANAIKTSIDGLQERIDWIEHLLSGYIIRNFHFGDSYRMDTLIEDFRRQMEE